MKICGATDLPDSVCQRDAGHADNHLDCRALVGRPFRWVVWGNEKETT